MGILQFFGWKLNVGPNNSGVKLKHNIIFECLKEESKSVTLIHKEKPNCIVRPLNKHGFFEDAQKQLEKFSLIFQSISILAILREL